VGHQRVMTHVIAICGDLHCGSTVGLCPPEGMELDDGGLYEPSPAQRWLWDCWEQSWAIAKSYARGKHLSLILNGDLIDGDHHRTAQIASPLTGIHLGCAMESLRVPLALKPKAIHVLRGTPSHSGRSGSSEEAVAHALRDMSWPIIKDPETDKFSSYRRRLDIGDVRLDLSHHGRMGQRAHTRGSYSRLYGFDIWAEQMLETYTAMRHSDDPLKIFNERRPPDIAVRSHNHKYMDTGFDHRGITRVISAPAFQLATEWIHRIAAESLADIGIILLGVNKHEIEVKPVLFTPDRPKPLTL